MVIVKAYFFSGIFVMLILGDSISGIELSSLERFIKVVALEIIALARTDIFFPADRLELTKIPLPSSP